MRQPKIPMHPTGTVMQRLFGIVDLPPVGSTPPIELLAGWTNIPGIPKRISRNAHYLCQLEWAWSPMHGRISAYYLHRARRHWILWEKMFLDNEWRWLTRPVARCLHGKVNERDAALSLLARVLGDDVAALESAPGPYHWINEVGLLTVADLKALAREVWPREVGPVQPDPVQVRR